ncbi:Os01g0564950, partial [Oryza sativa Japonica Group]
WYGSNLTIIIPLFGSYRTLEMEETKWTYMYNLIRRAHRDEDVQIKVTEYLRCIERSSSTIWQRYGRQEDKNLNTKEMVEVMVLDGLFIIEVLIRHWINNGKIKTDQSVYPEAEGPQVPPKVKLEPHALRLDLVILSNQIPFFVLEDLFTMTPRVPELRDTKLKVLILYYLFGSVGDGELVCDESSVYHILHLVYKYLTFSKEQALPETPVPRLSLVGRAMNMLKKKRIDLYAFCKRTFSRSSTKPVNWLSWKEIPPLKELVRVGVRLKQAETYRFTEVKFKDGKLEIPAFTCRLYDARLLANLVFLEMCGWWPREERLFCSYVMFMAELISDKKDFALLFKKGIVHGNSYKENFGDLFMDSIVKLAEVGQGSINVPHFSDLIADTVHCYLRWTKEGNCRRRRD